MAGIWQILVPQKTEYTNLITNPSFEKVSTGWTAKEAGDTITLEDGAASHGFRLGYVAGAANASGAYATVSLTTGITYTFSIDFRGTGAGAVGLTYEMYFATAAGVLEGTKHTFTCASITEWQRESVTWACDSTASHRLYVANAAANSETFDIDAAMCVASASDITYFDGDTANCRWTGQAHASTSVCEVWARNVGIFTDLQDYNLRVLTVDGVGIASSTHQVGQYAMMPGAEYKGHKVQPRVIMLTNAIYGTSLENLHSKRKSIVDLFKHDLTAGDQPIILRYTGAKSNRPVEITCYLDSEVGVFDLPKLQRQAIRLVCYDPYFHDIRDTAHDLDQNNSTTYRYFASKRSGEWAAITPSAVTDPGTGVEVMDIAVLGEQISKVGPAGTRGWRREAQTSERIYVAGYFLNWDGIAAADYIAYYDPVTAAWSAIEAGTNGRIYTLAIGPDGLLYAGGSFTQIGATAAARIAYWDGAAWNAMGTGFPTGGAICMDIIVGNEGYVYACGSDGAIGGVADANYVGYWNGAAWSAMATGVDSTAYALAKDTAGNIYLGGAHTGNVSKWNGTSWTSLAAPADCYGLAVAPNGYVYAAMNGDEYVKYWNGQSWVSMGGGFTTATICNNLDIDENGLVWVGGDFSAVGGFTDLRGLACWNGYSWVRPDIQLPAATVVQAVKCVGSDIYLGFDTATASTHSSTTTVTNPGTARVYPVIKIQHSGVAAVNDFLAYIKNETTGATLWFDYNLQSDEVLYLDFRENQRSFTSAYYGNIWRGILRGSQFSDFYLLPGANDISVFADTPVADLMISYAARYESIDGTAA